MFWMVPKLAIVGKLICVPTTGLTFGRVNYEKCLPSLPSFHYTINSSEMKKQMRKQMCLLVGDYKILKAGLLHISM